MSKKKKTKDAKKFDHVTRSLFGTVDKSTTLETVAVFHETAIKETIPSEYEPDPDDNVTKKVRNQYENLPYPHRNPEDDKKRVRYLPIDVLEAVNQKCFQGKRDFDKEFRVLDAGGGTGDATTFLAVQTGWLPNAEVVYLDLSKPSMEIARKRVHNQSIRYGNPKIESRVDFRIGSLLDVESMGIGKFDMIVSSGVLHHLADPAEGLRALASVLKDDGAMCIMVYGQVGRTSVYPMQEIMRLINQNEDDMDEMIENTRRLFRLLPNSNLHKKNGRWTDPELNAVELYDLFLHSQDRAFTYTQLKEWALSAGLCAPFFPSTMVAYLNPTYQVPRIPQRIRSRLEKMSYDDLFCFSEYLIGNLNKYELYLSKQENPGVDWDDWDLIPSFSFEASAHKVKENLQRKIHEIEFISFSYDVHPKAIDIPVDVSPLAKASYPLIDDRRTMREIVAELLPAFPRQDEDVLRQELYRLWNNLTQFGKIHFRHTSSNVRNLNRSNFTL